MSAAFSVPGFNNRNTGSGAVANKCAPGNVGAAAVRAVPLSPDQERSTYFPQHTTTAATTLCPIKRIEPSKLERQHQLPARTMPSSYPTGTPAAVPAPLPHIADDNDEGVEDSLSDVFGGDSFDTWVSGVILHSEGHLLHRGSKKATSSTILSSNHNPTVSKIHRRQEFIDDQSSEGAVLVDHPEDSSSVTHHQFANQHHQKFASVQKPFTQKGPPQRVMSCNSGLSTSKAHTDDWDVLTPSQHLRHQQRPSTEYDVCSVSPSAASGTHNSSHQTTLHAAQVILGTNISTLGSVSPTVSAVVQSASSPIVPGRRGGGGAAAKNTPTPPPPSQTAPASGRGCGGVGMKRVASSWASMSSGGRKTAPTPSSGGNVDTLASSAAVHQYHMDDF